MGYNLQLDHRSHQVFLFFIFSTTWLDSNFKLFGFQADRSNQTEF
jgi:hypothetical protein